jgi:hypothetical protein
VSVSTPAAPICGAARESGDYPHSPKASRPSLRRLPWRRSRERRIRRTAPLDLAATLGKLPRGAKKKLAGLTTGAALLRVEESRPLRPCHSARRYALRHGAYRVAIDTRVDTRWERRTHHFEVTAATVAQLCAAAASAPRLPS